MNGPPPPAQPAPAQRAPAPGAPTRPAARRHLGIIVAAWCLLQLGGIFSPGLLDDVDSVYIEIAREMLHRHDFVTPYIDGIRFFDKPPLMYWMAAASMRVFGEHDWAARLPLSLAVLGLLLAVYTLGRRLYPEGRAGLYAALIMATSLGPYLYTRFFIPDILICLWMTLGVQFFLSALDGAAGDPAGKRGTLGPTLGFAVTLALNLLTKGLIGLVFPLGFVLVYTLVTRQYRLLRRLPLGWGVGAFAVVALPWHLLAALRNPAIAMPPGLGLPAKAGWAWFYLYNEHVARFVGRRIPQDYGNTPRWLFLLYALLWMAPWAAFLPAAVTQVYRHLGHRYAVTMRQREAALTTSIWALVVLVFFSISHRQEYYSLPALPALALVIGGALAAADEQVGSSRAALLCHRAILLPVTGTIAAVCAYFAVTSPRPAPGVDLSQLLSQNPELYNLSLGHLFDLTAAAMGLFRGPLTAVAVGMLAIGVVGLWLRQVNRTSAANLTVAAGMALVLLAMHAGLVRFNPILGSKPLADAIVAEQSARPRPGDILALDGELTSGSTLLFYTRQPVRLVNGRVNGPWFGSFWPDAPGIFEDEASLRHLWAGPARVFLLTYDPAKRSRDLGTARMLASAGGKSILTNR